MERQPTITRTEQGATTWRWRRLFRRLIQKGCSKIYRDADRNTRRSMMIAGTARSGTTWLAEVIASELACRIMFEPFHARKVRAFREFNYFQYMRPTEPNSDLFSYCQRVFSGTIRDPWIDRQVEHVFPKYRLIKEIRANLFLKWMQNSFPEIPIFFIMRHPCAVVLSRMQLNWATDGDIEPLLGQRKLIDDFLSDYLDVIRGATTPEEKHAVIWCISNLVPIRQFGPRGLNTVFYENLQRHPAVEIPRIFQLLNCGYQDDVFEVVDRPSMTSRATSTIVGGEGWDDPWKKKLSPAQIGRILSIVEKFDLDYIYGESTDPLVSAV